MKRFIKKTIFFLFPIIVLLAITESFYTKNQGDLSRIGYIPSDKDYRKKFATEYHQPLSYTEISNADLPKRKKFNLLTIGDSFSQQGRIGYQNYVSSQDDSISVLNLDIRTSNNPINMLYGALNGNLLDSIAVDHIILQSVERDIVKRAQQIDSSFVFTYKRKQSHPLIDKEGLPQSSTRAFPPAEVVKFPVYNILYHLDDNAFFSKVLRLETDTSLFSGSLQGEILILKEDVKKAIDNNHKESVLKLNQELNHLAAKLRQKNIKLIVLPSPDKYDVYYDYIKSKDKYPKPIFFDLMQGMDKEYLYINSHEVISQAIEKEQDVYFFDDTHWSPLSSKLIAQEILRVIAEDK